MMHFGVVFGNTKVQNVGCVPTSKRVTAATDDQGLRKHEITNQNHQRESYCSSRSQIRNRTSKQASKHINTAIVHKRMQHRRSSTTDQRQSALSFPLQQSSMHRTPSSRDGGLKATSEAEELDARSTMSTTTAACDSTATAASMVLMKGRSLVDSKSSNSENNSNNGDESGYGSDSSPDSSGGDGGGADSTGCDDVDDDYDDGGDMRERIYFLREKQLLMERAGNVLSRRAERNYAAAMASDLCRGLTTESSSSASSSCGSSSSSGEEAAEKSGLKKRKRAATATTTTTSNINIWIEAKRVLSEMNKKGSGYDDDCSGPILPIPTSIYRKRCAPTPIHPLIDHRIVQRVRSKLYDAESDVGTGQALLGSPFAPSNQVRHDGCCSRTVHAA
jgi:hypothetical protein